MSAASQRAQQAATSTAAPAKVACPPHVLEAIYGKPKGSKLHQYEASLQRWWEEYSDRKNDEEDEHVADSLLYDRSHLPRSIPAPSCVVLKSQQGKPEAAAAGAAAAATIVAGTVQQPSGAQDQ